MEKKEITLSTVVHAPISHVWACWTLPEHITGWNFASDDWHCPQASNDLRVGGRLETTMASTDGSTSFTFGGVYEYVEPGVRLVYRMDDGRRVEVRFAVTHDGTHVEESFEPETLHSEELQRQGWLSILQNFARYTEKAAL